MAAVRQKWRSLRTPRMWRSLRTPRVWRLLKVYFLAVVFGLRISGVRLLQWAFKPAGFFSVRRRNTQPPCLNSVPLGTHVFVKLTNVKLHYVESGDKSRKLLLLLHGYPDFWYTWRHQLTELSEHFWVIALDMKGFGDSDKPLTRSPYRMDTVVEELKEFVNIVGRDKCHVMGHDLGGMLGWHFVAKYPEMVEKFVAMSSPHPQVLFTDIENNKVPCRWWFYFCRLPYLPELEAMKNDLVTFDRIFSSCANKKSSFTKADMEAYKYTFSRKGGFLAHLTAGEDWTGPINYFRSLPEFWDQTWPPVPVPTLLLVGNHDPQVSLESVCRSSELLQSFSLKVVEGGHHLHLEMPHYVNQLLLQFLQDGQSAEKLDSRRPSKSILGKMFGASMSMVSSTVQYGNQVLSSSLDVVSRKTSNAGSTATTCLWIGGQVVKPSVYTLALCATNVLQRLA